MFWKQHQFTLMREAQHSTISYESKGKLVEAVVLQTCAANEFRFEFVVKTDSLLGNAGDWHMRAEGQADYDVWVGAVNERPKLDKNTGMGHTQRKISAAI